MNQKPDLPPEQREIVDRFIVDLPKILAGADPFKWADTDRNGGHNAVEFETKKCSVEGCDWYQYQAGLCHEHHRGQWS